jgi:hypothetical protein
MSSYGLAKIKKAPRGEGGHERVGDDLVAGLAPVGSVGSGSQVEHTRMPDGELTKQSRARLGENVVNGSLYQIWASHPIVVDRAPSFKSE